MIVALAGGVGGAKLAEGLAQCRGAELAVIVNTGDDFRHLGLHVSPDVDTVMYTLAGMANSETGWGVAGESWNFLEQLGRLGGADWFRLGDRDLAVHVLRSAALERGERLTAITATFCRRLGIAARVLPMSDAPVATIVETAEGPLAFQDYFVRRRCEPAVTGFRFAGAADARPSPEIAAALAVPGLEAIVIAPSNPFVSIDPILAVPGMRRLVTRAGVPVVAVSPLVAGAALKGPTAKMMRELGRDPSAAAVAAHYRGVLTALLIDAQDAALAPAIRAMGLAVGTADTIMRDAADRRRVAEACLALAQEAGAARR